MSVLRRILRFFRKPPIRDPFDCVDIPGVRCRWELPRPCWRPSVENCRRYDCNMRGGHFDE